MRSTADPYGVLTVFGRDVVIRSRRTQARWIDRAVRYWRERGFPYPALNDHEAEREFRSLQRLRASEVIHRRQVAPSTLGLRLANSFHPQIWEIPARRHLRAPVDHFRDDETLRKLLIRAAQFWPDRRCWNAQCVRSVLRIYAGGRVSNFRPAAARAIIDRYSKAGETVLDFSAGFGGRLLGCLTLDRQYLGIEPASAQVAGLQGMLSTLHRYTTASAKLVCGCAEVVMRHLEPRSVDLIFSSPPYFNVERYSSEATQSYRRYPTYLAWRDEFLRPILAASSRTLRHGGHLVLNVADAPPYPLASDACVIASEFFHRRTVLRLLMHSRPLQRAAGMKPFRWEPVLVFEKR